MGLIDYLRTLTHHSPFDGSAKKGHNEVRLLFLGLDNAGKTSILKRITDEDLMDVTPTMGFQIKQLDYAELKVVMWDVGGQKSLRAYWRNYFSAVDGLIYVIDSADRRRMEETGVELQMLLEENQLEGVPFLIFANKQDLLHALSPQEITQGLNLYAIRDRQWQIFPCSAKQCLGIKDGMEFLMQEIRDNRMKRSLGLEV